VDSTELWSNRDTTSNYHSILVLDDELDMVTMIKMGLQKNFNVSAFTDPILALEYFEANAAGCDLVISDLRMPRMNGFEFIRKVKEIKPNVKVFIMTASEINDFESSRLLLLPDVPIDELIQKPMSIRSLNIMIENQINGLRNPIVANGILGLR
jgi:response regulator RpfG family c-di-GMP phosphodiesterase